MTRISTVISLLVACSTRTPTARERALEQLPATAQLVAAADGVALSQPGFRRLIDAMRPHVPAKLGCAIDAALTSEVVALAADASGTTVVITTRAHVACPALSRVADDRYVATIGAGALVDDPAKSVARDPRWARARPYLVGEELAIAADHATGQLYAAVQPEPIDAWVAIDSTDPASIETTVGALIQRLASTPAAGKLRINRKGVQVVVRGDKLVADDLATIAKELVRIADSPSAAAAPSPFACPPDKRDPVIASCMLGTHYVVTSVKLALEQMTGAGGAPVVEGGEVAGLRLDRDAKLVLARGDVILAVDGHRISSADQLAQVIGRAGKQAQLAVRRDGVDVVLRLTQLQ